MSVPEGTRSVLGGARAQPLVTYTVAVAAVAGVTVLKLNLGWLGRDAPVSIYLGAVMFVAWLGGTGPGLVATALSCASASYYFAAPYDSLAVASADDAVRLALAAGEGALISLVTGALHRTGDELRRQMSERLSAETALRRATEQSIHAHKMRAIGEFAGGVAHDFTNMLTVVKTCLGLLERRLASDHPAREELAEIRAATDRAAALARQLLTFARRRDLEPTLVHLHDVLARIRPIVCRVVGSAIQVDLSLEATSDLVVADASQLEQAFVNMAANGRDAMPGGGTLTIATADASFASGDASPRHAGAHVEILVRDSGIGMDDATKRRVFEPFFTTKAVGAGTGLGLSMVFGVVEASDGSIAVESAPGRGATFRILLPVAEGAAQATES